MNKKPEQYLIYVAGPFRAKSSPRYPSNAVNQWEQAQNIRRAEALALEVWKSGHACICPHANTMHFQGSAPDSVFLEGDLLIVEKCDGILCTPDWMESSGACGEISHAERLGIPTSTNLQALLRSITRKRAQVSPPTPTLNLDSDEVKTLDDLIDSMFGRLVISESRRSEKGIWELQYQKDLAKLNLLKKIKAGF